MKKITFLFLLLPFIIFGQIQVGQNILGQTNDAFFGKSISLSNSGNIIAIGSSNNTSSNIDLGHVSILSYINGQWTQIGNDIDGSSNDIGFGRALSLSDNGNIVAIGAPNSDYNGNDSGHVSIFQNINNTWTQIGNDIVGENGNDNFGYSISLSNDGTTIAIGGIGNDINGFESGYVKIFKLINNTWNQIGSDIYGEAFSNYSGWSVDLSGDGNIVAISAIFNSDNGNQSGHVRVFENINNSWTQIGNDIDGENSGDFFGSSISISDNGNIIAIGALYNDGNGFDSGHVRVFENINNIWTQIGNDIDGEYSGDNFGRSVSISNNGDILVVGAPINTENQIDSGHARIYININSIWTKVGDDIDGEYSEDFFGNSVSISGDGELVAISAPNNDQYALDSGYVRIFSIASELALLEVIDDINGNNNGVNITAEQLNKIIGVSGAIEGVNYTTALNNGTYGDVNNPTTTEIQNIINQVNNSLSNLYFEKEELNIYPNPSSSNINIKLSNDSIIKKVTIYNNLGQSVIEDNRAKIDISRLSKGLYFLTIETNKGKYLKQFIAE